MLILSRKSGEAVIITAPGGEQIIVKHCGMNREKEVQFGIEAPREFMICRQEIAHTIFGKIVLPPEKPA